MLTRSSLRLPSSSINCLRHKTVLLRDRKRSTAKKCKKNPAKYGCQKHKKKFRKKKFKFFLKNIGKNMNLGGGGGRPGGIPPVNRQTGKHYLPSHYHVWVVIITVAFSRSTTIYFPVFCNCTFTGLTKLFQIQIAGNIFRLRYFLTTYGYAREQDNRIMDQDLKG